MMKTNKQKTESLSADEGEDLIARLEDSELSERDKSTLIKIVRGYIYLSIIVSQTGVRLKTVREFFFPRHKKNTEKKEKLPTKPKGPNPASYQNDVTKPLTRAPSEETRKRQQNTCTKHGRLSVNDYTGAKHEQCTHDKLKSEDFCPQCKKGKLYKFDTKKQIQLFGHAPVQSVCYHVEVLRCASCQAIFNARESQGKYHHSAKSIIAIARYYMGMPFYRLEQFQSMVGTPLPDSTQWNMSEQLYYDVKPAFDALVYHAAQAFLIHHDDTGAKILSLIKENKTLSKEVRYGTHSTGIVAIGEQVIILYFTGRSHAGENLGKLLDLRDSKLPKVIQMSDASPSNQPTGHRGETVPSYCNAHSVRKFKEVERNFPEFCENVLVGMAEVFRLDHHCQSAQMNDIDRRDYHAKHSAPVMYAIKAWIESQLTNRLVEDNSSLGSAIHYMLKHWENLTRFLTTPGVPLDNNIVERILKRLIFQRKNSFFFNNEYSAYVGCTLTSIIMTCEAAGENAFEYLNCLQENRFAVARSPEEWLPWNYKAAGVLAKVA